MTTEKNPRPSGRGVVKYLSVCSGIEAATVGWHPLGWAPFAFSEIEPFPSAVLAHHYPETPNLGDMTKFKEWPDAAIDLLVGGTPCQSFSVAGLRKGLDDPRGNLMLTYLAIADRYRPRWLVWENVPGVLSSNGGRDFGTFLDMLEMLGYVCDVEILDAQFFGVPQRRRRVFVCAQHRDDLLSQKTDTSALTITQCLQEILLCILSEARSRFASGQGNLDLPSRSKDGAKRRMELFGLAGEADCWPMLLENLVEAFRRLPQEQRRLGVTHGEPVKEPMQGVQSTGSQTESLFTLTEQSLKTALGDALEVMRSFITSTETSSTTQAQIFSCSRAALLIAKLTQRLSQSSPAFWNSALSSLTAVEEFTDYARSTSSDLFGDMERLQSWCDFIEQAEHSNDAFIGFGVECFGEIFPLPGCLQGHPAPRREAGKDVAGGAARSVAIRGRDGIPHAELGDEVANAILTPNGGRGGVGVGVGAALVPMPHADISPAIKARDSKGVSSDGDGDGAILVPMVAHSLRAEGFDASEDGSGRGTPLVPVCFSAKDHGADAMFDLSPTLRAGGHSGSHANAGVMPAVAFAENSRSEIRLEGGDGTRTGAQSAGGGKPGQGVPMAMHGMKVRRLTPRECERLQGFSPVLEILRIEVCIDHQNKSALAEIKCHRLQSSVWSAAESEYLQFVSTVEKSFITSPAYLGKHVAVYARQHYEGSLRVLRRNQSGSNLSANNAVELGWSRSHIQNESFAAALAPHWESLEKQVSHGKAALHQSTRLFLAGKNGDTSAKSFGVENEVIAKDAEIGAGAEKFITLHPGRVMPTCDSPIAISLCSVINAISSFIQSETAPENFCIDLVLERDYTNIPYRNKPAADGPRYKALGNSMAVPVMAWIGRRIAMVDSLANRDLGALVYPEKAA